LEKYPRRREALRSWVMYLMPTGGILGGFYPGRKVVDNCLNFGLFESVERGFELVRGFQKTDEGFLLIRYVGGGLLENIC
jgi:hypothetical protein